MEALGSLVVLTFVFVKHRHVQQRVGVDGRLSETLLVEFQSFFLLAVEVQQVG